MLLETIEWEIYNFLNIDFALVNDKSIFEEFQFISSIQTLLKL